jgi:hypothetical protein
VNFPFMVACVIGFSAGLSLFIVISVISGFVLVYVSITISLSVLFWFGIYQYIIYNFKRTNGIWQNTYKFCQVRLLDAVLNTILAVVVLCKLVVQTAYIALILVNIRNIVYGTLMGTSISDSITNSVMSMCLLVIFFVLVQHFILIIFMFDRKEWTGCIAFGFTKSLKKNQSSKDLTDSELSDYHHLETKHENYKLVEE